jgi:hypothetical protein
LVRRAIVFQWIVMPIRDTPETRILLTPFASRLRRAGQVKRSSRNLEPLSKRSGSSAATLSGNSGMSVATPSHEKPPRRHARIYIGPQSGWGFVKATCSYYSPRASGSARSGRHALQIPRRENLFENASSSAPSSAATGGRARS